jgi:hypothetical protein
MSRDSFPCFWRKLASGKFSPRVSVLSFAQVLRSYLRRGTSSTSGSAMSGHEDMSKLPLPLKTAEGLRRFGGQAMILMSARDIIAREFDEVVASSKAWQGLLETPSVPCLGGCRPRSRARRKVRSSNADRRGSITVICQDRARQLAVQIRICASLRVELKASFACFRCSDHASAARARKRPLHGEQAAPDQQMMRHQLRVRSNAANY